MAWGSAVAPSPLDAGHRAMRDFAAQHMPGAGAVADLPAGRSLGPEEAVVQPGHILSGVAQIRLLMSTQACVTVQADLRPDRDPRRRAWGPKRTCSPRPRHSKP